MRVTRALASGVLATAAVAAMTVGSTATASAAPQARGSFITSGTVAPAVTCPYPYVCFIENGKIGGKFQDVTSTWQPLPSVPAAPITVVNSRHDDIAYIRWVGGTTACLPPETTFYVTGGSLNAVRIDSSATCS
ncbi:hypothetical protein GA0115240_156449 [Streptomyces sp. DvalAA-14]|uniref:hypothetical protein n=1 Tax=unclassified Streptomyces TaxID=2593676 RepID=UPI00081B0CF5|nr:MULTISPECIES: hypothetical protein [unclassified Streptomyces]MYS23820.1 hypothetical protein [Streptomyces sp. SID4948]SCE38998.1 hypothetical protein GA0115240_156449 [Streptomyces sp. DvalAA-14]